MLILTTHVYMDMRPSEVYCTRLCYMAWSFISPGRGTCTRFLCGEIVLRGRSRRRIIATIWCTCTSSELRAFLLSLASGVRGHASVRNLSGDGLRFGVVLEASFWSRPSISPSGFDRRRSGVVLQSLSMVTGFDRRRSEDVLRALGSVWL